MPDRSNWRRSERDRKCRFPDFRSAAPEPRSRSCRPDPPDRDRNPHGHRLQPAGRGPGWSTFVTSWAKIDHIGGKEVVNQTEYAAEVTDRFTLPYVPGITQKMRVNYTDPAGKTHFYDILFVENVEERSFFVSLLAKEIYSNT